MPAKRNVSGSWVDIKSPYVNVNGVQRAGTRVWRNVGGTWYEAWPLLPTAPASSNPPLSPYRNDRIELDFVWGGASAPANPRPGLSPSAAISGYQVKVYIGGSLYNTYELGVVTSMTLTNGGAGFQGYAGQQCYYTVAARTAYGLGPLVTSSTITVNTMPSPPAVTGLFASLNNGTMTTSWNHANGNTLAYFDMLVTVNGVPYSTSFGKAGSVSTNYSPWAFPSYGFPISVTVVAVGVNGLRSAGVTYNLRMPALPSISCKWQSRKLRANWSGGNAADSIRMFTASYSGGGVYSEVATTGQGAGYIEDPDSNFYDEMVFSGSWLRLYYIKLVPYNEHGTAPEWYPPNNGFRKVGTPYYITPNDQNTNIGGVWQGGSTFVQGGTAYGQAFGYLYFGNKFRDELGANVLGYTLDVTAGTISFCRTSNGGDYPIYPQIYIHTGTYTGDSNNGNWGGGHQLPAIGRNQGTRGNFPSNWVQALIQQQNGWKGFGVYTGEAPGPGGTSAGWAEFLGAGYTEGFVMSVGNVPWGTVAIYHNN